MQVCSSVGACNYPLHCRFWFANHLHHKPHVVCRLRSWPALDLHKVLHAHGWPNLMLLSALRSTLQARCFKSIQESQDRTDSLEQESARHLCISLFHCLQQTAISFVVKRGTAIIMKRLPIVPQTSRHSFSDWRSLTAQHQQQRLCFCFRRGLYRPCSLCLRNPSCEHWQLILLMTGDWGCRR